MTHFPTGGAEQNLLTRGFQTTRTKKRTDEQATPRRVVPGKDPQRCPARVMVVGPSSISYLPTGPHRKHARSRWWQPRKDPPRHPSRLVIVRTTLRTAARDASSSVSQCRVSSSNIGSVIVKAASCGAKFPPPCSPTPSTRFRFRPVFSRAFCNSNGILAG